MGYLILLRHGESRWNAANKFTGWVDVPLSEKGVQEALRSAKALQGLHLHAAFTSELKRAQETLLLVLAKQDYTGIFLHQKGQCRIWSCHPAILEKQEIPVSTHEALNERYYGQLQGMNKLAARKKFGEEQVLQWRRNFTARPPGGESLSDTYNRTVPYYQHAIAPLLKKGKNVLIAAHGNSLRAIIKYLDNIADEKIPHLELPFGKPIIYKQIRGKLVKQNYIHSFNRPLHWK